ncbi:MAG: threonine synthase [Citromicrobium sp.]|nr:MAG: threonine synthase [Citromicrobium sp.]
MTQRIPILPTLIVAAAIATMIGLGVWQLQRLQEKEALLARYADVARQDSVVDFPLGEGALTDALYRRSSVTCTRVLSQRTTPGRNRQGQTGVAQMARCALAGGGEAEVALGWTVNPQTVTWSGGEVTGIVGPAGKEARLVASPPQAGLEPLSPPDPADIPNNHLAYAGQWFFFALTALVIYILALRRRRMSA